MTDKYIPSSKLLALPQFSDPITGQPAIFLADLSALIDEAPEVEPMAKVLTRSNLGFSTRGSIEWIGDKYSIPDDALLYASPPPSPDLTKLVGELVEAL